MARPRKDSVDYFPHFVNWGKTVPILESRFGNDGYSSWFKILESIGKAAGHFIDCSDSIEWEFLVQKLRVSDETATEILDLLCKLGTIDRDLWRQDKVIWCQNFVDHVADVYTKRRVSVPEKPALRGFCPENPRQPGVLEAETPQSTAQHSTAQESSLEANASSSAGTDAAVVPFERSDEYAVWKKAVLACWNSAMESPPFSKVSKVTEDRDTHLRARYGEKVFRERYADVFRIINESSFCRGGGPRGWIASFDWIVKNNGNYTKALEGKYERQHQPPQNPQRTNGQTNGRNLGPNKAEYDELGKKWGIGTPDENEGARAVPDAALCEV